MYNIMQKSWANPHFFIFGMKNYWNLQTIMEIQYKFTILKSVFSMTSFIL